MNGQNDLLINQIVLCDSVLMFTVSNDLYLNLFLTESWLQKTYEKIQENNIYDAFMVHLRPFRSMKSFIHCNSPALYLKYKKSREQHKCE